MCRCQCGLTVDRVFVFLTLDYMDVVLMTQYPFSLLQKVDTTASLYLYLPLPILVFDVLFLALQ